MSKLEISRAQRLDQYVVEQFPILSRAYAAKLCDTGKVRVNGAVAKPGYKIRPADSVVIDYDPAEIGQIPDIKLPILYEDDDCLVIDKPVGVLTHSKGAFNPEATVATFIRTHIQHLEGDRAGIVHRLDRATSGVIICAKSPAALSWLQKQFSQRKVKKTYCAIVSGQLTEKEAVIDIPIERNPKKPQTFRAGINGKPAVTEYKVLSSTTQYSLLVLKPQTGRTHQLRVHLSYLKHPIVGDVLYGGEPADRLYLHAEELEITLPNKQRKVFRSEVPASFKKFLDA